MPGATPPPAATAQPRSEPQIDLPHLGDIWERMQREKGGAGPINPYRIAQAPQAGALGAQVKPRLGAFGADGSGLPGHGPGAGASPALSIDPRFLADHQAFMQSIGDGRLSPDELAQVHGVTNGVNAYRLGRHPGPIGGEVHQAAAADLTQAAGRLAGTNPRVATAVLAYRGAHDAAARRNWGGGQSDGSQGGPLRYANHQPDRPTLVPGGYTPHPAGAPLSVRPMVASPLASGQQTTDALGALLPANNTGVGQSAVRPQAVHSETTSAPHPAQAQSSVQKPLSEMSLREFNREMRRQGKWTDATVIPNHITNIPNPGAYFRSKREAARQISKVINPPSRRSDNEFSWLYYQDPNTKLWGFTDPWMTGQTGGVFSLQQIMSINGAQTAFDVPAGQRLGSIARTKPGVITAVPEGWSGWPKSNVTGPSTGYYIVKGKGHSHGRRGSMTGAAATIGQDEFNTEEPSTYDEDDARLNDPHWIDNGKPRKPADYGLESFTVVTPGGKIIEYDGRGHRVRIENLGD